MMADAAEANSRPMEFSIEGYLHWKRTRLSSQNGTNDAGEAASRKKSHRRDSGDTCATAGQPDGSSSGSGIETIFLQYEVVRNILSRLPLHDLHSAAEVCSTWNSIANIILQSRTNLEWTMMTSSDFMLRKDFEEKFYCDPKLCILFSTRLKGRMSQLVYNHVGPDCPVLRVQGAGIVGARTGTLVTQEIEESVGSFGVSALFLPAIPNVKYSIFHLNKDKMETFTNKEEFTPAEVQNIFSIDPADEVKCLLLFCGSRSNLLTRLVSSVQERQTAKCVVAGGLCSLKRGNANGVVISGANVAAVSMLLPSTAIARSRVEEYFQKFQKDTRSIVAKRTVCFMFACVGRGMLMYNESNVESDLFRKYFPSTPLVGFFGYGEINSNLISEVSTDKSNLPNGTDLKIEVHVHDFCSVFVFLGLS